MKVPELLPEYANVSGAKAAHRLFVACAERSESSIFPVAEFLVSLYDSRFAQLDTYMLCRRVTGEYFEDVLTVMMWFRTTENGFDIHHCVGLEEGTLFLNKVIAKFLTERNGEY
ncbi:hypothetical protein WS86_15185 [Burkholderia savannae]|uniref:hypothetical protein n=1 Tax=Burkholderia savannae TaxID=1637837 RepID=UPI000755C711|nr:hypothetical protein [Burkholderia savannae]AOJ81820.1 hypothetical protein WS86_15185 [Burkholderia savannae]